MKTVITRRAALRSVAVAAALAGARPSMATRALAAPTGARLASNQNAFEQEFGSPKQIGDLTQFESSEGNTAVYYVHFSNTGADAIEVDYTHLGGVSEEDADIGQSRFLWDDSQPVASFIAGGLQFKHSMYHATIWFNDALAAETGRSGYALVLDDSRVQGDGPEIPTPYNRANIAMEAFDVQEVHPRGTQATLGSPTTDWQDVYGEASSSQRAMHVANPPVEILFLGTRWSSNGQPNIVQEIDTNLDMELPMADAIDLVGQFLPQDAELTQTFYLLPSPTGPLGIRFQVWQLPSIDDQAMVLLYINGGEQSGTVSRILMSLTHIER